MTMFRDKIQTSSRYRKGTGVDKYILPTVTDTIPFEG